MPMPLAGHENSRITLGRKSSPMRLRVLLLSFLLAAIGDSNSLPSTTPVSGLRSYNGTSSAGGFLTINLDPVAHTLTYTDLTNGDSGVVPFLENSDGAYELNDPEGILLAAYELPNYGLLIEAADTGRDHDAQALISAVPASEVSVSTWAGQDYKHLSGKSMPKGAWQDFAQTGENATIGDLGGGESHASHPLQRKNAKDGATSFCSLVLGLF